MTAIELTKEELRLILEACDDAIYWRSDERYRNNASAWEPYSDDEETREHVRKTVKVREYVELLVATSKAAAAEPLEVLQQATAHYKDTKANDLLVGLRKAVAAIENSLQGGSLEPALPKYIIILVAASSALDALLTRGGELPEAWLPQEKPAGPPTS